MIYTYIYIYNYIYIIIYIIIYIYTIIQKLLGFVSFTSCHNPNATVGENVQVM
jgi:hypothetical protein